MRVKDENETEARGPGPTLTPQDEDVLDAVRAYRQNGVTVESLQRVQYLNHIPPEQLGASLARLKAAGQVRMEIAGEKKLPTYFPLESEGQDDTREENKAVSEEVTNEGAAEEVATKRRGRKAGAKKGGAKKGAAKKTSKRAAGVTPIAPIGVAQVRSLTADTFNALEAAYVELAFIQQWGEPSPRCGEVLAMLERGRQPTT